MRRAWGPVLWNRPWIIAAGAALGAATAVKWSGLYVLAGLGIYLVVTDALARRRAGVGFWPADAALRQGRPPSCSSCPWRSSSTSRPWTGWLVTDGGYDRHAADPTPGDRAGVWSWVPPALQSLWMYHEAIYDFHVGLTPAQLREPRVAVAAPAAADLDVLPVDAARRGRLRGRERLRGGHLRACPTR